MWTTNVSTKLNKKLEINEKIRKTLAVPTAGRFVCRFVRRKVVNYGRGELKHGFFIDKHTKSARNSLKYIHQQMILFSWKTKITAKSTYSMITGAYGLGAKRNVLLFHGTLVRFVKSCIWLILYYIWWRDDDPESESSRAPYLKPLQQKVMLARIDAIFRMKGEFDWGSQSRPRERSGR
jgi:hypothetical protein